MTALTKRPAIRPLPREVTSRIAAGEVVERPVSVVRELLDNAIDAGASRVEITIAEGGINRIRIADDGRGISPEEVEIAFERHATSKIVELDDLRRIRTLGFRGEALPAIAAAGDVQLTTRAEGNPVGVQLTLHAGEVVRRVSKPGAQGTIFDVTSLFERLPARRKFLGTPASESRRITVLVSHYALAYPGIAFTLVNGSRTALHTPGDGHLRHAFAAVHGADQAAAMLDVDFAEGPIRVSGLAGPPSVHRGNRSGISAFINGRWVQSRPLTYAVAEIYRNELPVGRFPVAALAIQLPEEEVDVNVHPAKAEVRFRDERAVVRAARHAVQAALEASPPVAFSPGPPASTGPVPAPSLAPNEPWSDPRPNLRDRLDPPAALRPPAGVQAALPGAQPATPADDPTARPGSQRELLPVLRVVGQMASTYIVCEGPDGMYLLDQHAAHERVQYDRLLANVRGPEASQPLLEPALLELDPLRAALLDEHLPHLESLGLDLEPFGENAFLLRAVAPGFGGDDIPAAITAFLDQLGGERRVDDPFRRTAATIACHSSVRAGMALATEEMRQLVSDLEATASPRTCPHGRPTLLHVSGDALARQFGRK